MATGVSSAAVQHVAAPDVRRVGQLLVDGLELAVLRNILGRARHVIQRQTRRAALRPVATRTVSYSFTEPSEPCTVRARLLDFGGCDADLPLRPSRHQMRLDLVAARRPKPLWCDVDARHGDVVDEPRPFIEAAALERDVARDRYMAKRRRGVFLQ